MKKMGKRKRGRWIAALAVLLLLLVWFFPRPVTGRDFKEVTTILYRAPEWKTLHYYYPIQGQTQKLDQKALEDILKKARAVPHLLPFEIGKPMAHQAATYAITLSDGKELWTVYLGEENRMDVDSFGKYSRYYTVLNADQVIKELDALLKPGEKENMPSTVIGYEEKHP